MPPTGSDIDAIAERLKLTRRAMGLTQAAISRMVGIGAQAWNNYERGQKRISIDQALRLCRSTGITLDWIYQGDMRSLPHDFVMRVNALDVPPPAPRQRA